MDRYLLEADIPECMNKGKTKLIQKDSQNNCPQNLKNSNVPNYDVANTNNTN